MSMDLNETLAASKMSAIQIAAVAITIGLNALDGFDVLSISFASPGISKEWGIDRLALGIVLSMELLGMGLGSIVLGGVADKVGRRRTLLGCLVVMAIGMFMATRASGVTDLSVWRIFTGLGIGGMLAAINAVAAEFSNARRRALNVSLMAIGYPIGGMVGGSIAKLLLKEGDWRVVFEFGAIITACFIPLVWFFVPESIAWLAQRQPPGALARINRTLARMNLKPVTSMPAISTEARRQSVASIFGPNLIRTTVLLTLAYFLHITTYYYMIKWTPKIVADMGFTSSDAAGVLVWLNVGGASGGAALGLLSLRFGLKTLTIAVMLLATVMVTVFGLVNADLARLSFICACTGFFTNAGVVGLYGILAQAFPTYVRATGTGFAVGIGRAGSVLAPGIAGYLFKTGYSLEFVSVTMALGSFIAAGAVTLLPFKSEKIDALPKEAATAL